MNLVIDIGNTRTKWALFDKGVLVIDQTFESGLFLTMVKEIFEVYPKISRAIVASVKKLKNKEFEVLSLFCKTHLLSHQSSIPFKNSYASPNTLGIDRIALATAAFYTYPKQNTLVIDLGTCITYDMMNDYGEYLGGAISPGFAMRYRAMHQQTDGLPLLEPEDHIDFIGNTTKTSMHSGVINGMLHELNGTINQYKDRFEHLTVILTGGDAQFFVKRLKNSIFANSKFLLEGLNYLLEYNKS
ncbi:type III pantothenate kinase [uncultured Croceitalea sp.]|uniref:type III pantothenate kinase n=1 Tax=uncultured Croceitalea sp. TaxID=1798908 RepID=UPI0033064AC6